MHLRAVELRNTTAGPWILEVARAVATVDRDVGFERERCAEADGRRRGEIP